MRIMSLYKPPNRGLIWPVTGWCNVGLVTEEMQWSSKPNFLRKFITAHFHEIKWYLWDP